MKVDPTTGSFATAIPEVTLKEHGEVAGRTIATLQFLDSDGQVIGTKSLRGSEGTAPRGSGSRATCMRAATRCLTKRRSGRGDVVGCGGLDARAVDRVKVLRIKGVTQESRSVRAGAGGVSTSARTWHPSGRAGPSRFGPSPASSTSSLRHCPPKA